MECYLGLGSNLGERWNHLAIAVRSLAELDAALSVSPVYETDPVGGPPGQGPYLNCVVRLTTTLTPRALLERCAALEAAARRVRLEHWGPRTLDVDILYIVGVEVHETDLEIPHPRMYERAFVLLPLATLAPDLVAGHLGLGTTELAGVRAVGDLVRSPDADVTGT